jgi:hypothetical protein
VKSHSQQAINETAALLPMVKARVENIRARFPSYPAPQNLVHHGQSQLLAMSILKHKVIPQDNGTFIPADKTYVFYVKNIRFIAYENIDHSSFQVYGTVYHLRIGTIYADGSFERCFEGDTLLGYIIDFDAIKRKIQCAKSSGTIRSRVVRAFRSFCGTKQKRLLLFGYCENIGHHLWNEHTGLDVLFQENLLEDIDGVIIGPYDFFGMGDFFKQLGIPVFRRPALAVKTRTVCSNDLYIATTEMVFSKTARDRLMLWISSQNIPATIPQKHRPVIIFQLRQHSRRWLSEEKGIVQLIKSFLANYPNAAFVIDGFSSYDGQSEQEGRFIKLEQNVVARITSHFPGTAPIYSTVGMDVRSKIFLLDRADLFLSPMGSAGVVALWLLKKPTIIYGPPSYYDWTQSDTKTLVEDAGTKVLWIDRSKIRMAGNGDDYELDWRVVFDAAISMLDEPQNPAGLYKTASL